MRQMQHLLQELPLADHHSECHPHRKVSVDSFLPVKEGLLERKDRGKQAREEEEAAEPQEKGGVHMCGTQSNFRGAPKWGEKRQDKERCEHLFACL